MFHHMTVDRLIEVKKYWIISTCYFLAASSTILIWEIATTSTSAAEKETSLGVKEVTMVAVTKAAAAGMIPTGTGGQLGRKTVGGVVKSMMAAVDGVIQVLEDIIVVEEIGVRPHKSVPEEQSGNALTLNNAHHTLQGFYVCSYMQGLLAGLFWTWHDDSLWDEASSLANATTRDTPTSTSDDPRVCVNSRRSANGLTLLLIACPGIPRTPPLRL